MFGFIDILEFIGTFAFAISGIRLAANKQFDWFGAYVVGLTTAIGGGTFRDLLLDVTPFWMTAPIYLICSGIALLWVIVFNKISVNLNNTFFLFDTLGLALFTVVGIEKTLSLDYPFWVAIIMGCITGAAGGILRDILINEVPLIFRKEIYATACLAGGIIYWGCSFIGLPIIITQILAGSVILLLRFLAAKYHLTLPILHSTDN